MSAGGFVICFYPTLMDINYKTYLHLCILKLLLTHKTGKLFFEYVPVLSDDGRTVQVVHKDNPEDMPYRFTALYVYDSFQPQEYDTIEEEPSQEPVYVGPAAGVFDDAEQDEESGSAPVRHFTEENYYEVTALGGGKYKITSVVSEEFLNSPDTVYPVTIDPSFTGSDSNAQDTFVWRIAGGTTNANYNLDYLRFGRKDGADMISYFRFNSLPTIPYNANITDARLKFTFRSGQTSGADGVCMIVQDHQWYESSLSWANQPYGEWGYSSSHNNYQYYNFYVKPFVEMWYNGSVPNYGVDFTYGTMINDYNSCVSSEGETNRAPSLTITYSTATTLPSGWSAGCDYYIRNYNSGKYLQGGSSVNSSVTQYTFTGASNQRWKLVNDGYGWFNLVPQSNTALRLDIMNGYDVNGTDLQLYSANNSSAQRFRIYSNGDGTVRIQPECSYISETQPGVNTERVLEVTNSSHSDGAQVQIWKYSGGNQMKWVFERVDTAKYSRAISSTPIHSARQAAWELSESEYNCWPASSKSNYYGWNTVARDAALAAINTTALGQAAAVSFAFPNGSDMLFHYLLEVGTPITVDFKYINNHWDFAWERRTLWLNEALAAAETLGVQGKTITFYSKSEEGNTPPGGAMNDYILCFNKYYTHIKCVVSKTSTSAYQATIYYYMEDIYDWDPTQENKVGLISQRDLWELHHGGFCKAYKVNGMNTIQVSWSTGQRIGNGAAMQDIS